MARIEPYLRTLTATVFALAIGLGCPLGAQAKLNANCLEKFRKERASILDHFGKLQNYKTYTEKKMLVLKARVEKYLVSIGDVLKNFDVDIFMRDELSKLSGVKDLSKTQRAALEDILAPAFKSRRLPAYAALEADLKNAGFGHLPVRKIRDAMDRSFRIWRTKIVFDETGSSVFNALAKSYVEKMGIHEFSMDLGLLGKNEWEAFFEAEKGPATFNPSMPGLMADLFTSTEAHESVHMVVETLAGQGHESPYAVWVKIDKKYKRTGAIGSRQKSALQAAADPLSDGDYYRNELYLDEFPAHVIQSAYLNVQLSKALRARLQETIDTVRRNVIKDELDDAFAEYLRAGKIDWSGYAEETKTVFDKFLAESANDGRTQVSKLLAEMTEYLNWVDLIQNSGSTAVAEARTILDEAIAAAKKAGQTGIHPKAGDLISIKPDNFIGIPGFKVEVRIPIDVIGEDKLYKRTPDAATVSFRLTNEGDLSKSITSAKLDKLISRTDWVADLAAKSKAITDRYAQYLDENGNLKDYTFADVFRLKQMHTELRKLTRETLERIRANK
jgi:hypothetical protein